ncbi:MAG: mechanosensitive ion channel, partial [Pirellulales bacterium]|nr:mechanosensitive ion channel [Pirellulales bacterium]
APQLLAAGILVVLAWGVATVARFLVGKGLAAVDLDRRLGRQTGEEDEKAIPLAKTISDAVYWLVLLLFLPAVLTALDVQGLLTPVQDMVGKILNFLPNLFAAAILFVVGWFVARIVQRIVSNLLAAVGADRLGDRVGLAQVLGQNRLSDVLGLVVYVLILIPVLIAFLSALKIEAVTQPASEMLNTILGALPNIFAAALVISIAYVVGRVVANLVAQVLAAVGFNKVPALLGLGKEQAAGKQTPSQWVGTLLLIAIVLLAVMQALQLMGFTIVGDLMKQFLLFAGHVLLGLVIIGLGLYFGKLVAETILTAGMSQARLWALTARIMVIVMAFAMGLRQMGLANEIIQLAFGLTLGAIAVAVAVSFGIGGRDAARNAIDNFLKSRKNGG